MDTYILFFGGLDGETRPPSKAAGSVQYLGGYNPRYLVTRSTVPLYICRITTHVRTTARTVHCHGWPVARAPGELFGPRSLAKEAKILLEILKLRQIVGEL